VNFEIYEEDLVEAGLDVGEHPAAVEQEHMLVIGAPGDVTVTITKEGQEYRVEIPDEIVEQIRFDDSTYEHPLPAYIDIEKGRIGLIFP
jgi:hypothetical protein